MKRPNTWWQVLIGLIDNSTTANSSIGNGELIRTGGQGGDGTPHGTGAGRNGSGPGTSAGDKVRVDPTWDSMFLEVAVEAAAQELITATQVEVLVEAMETWEMGQVMEQAMEAVPTTITAMVMEKAMAVALEVTTMVITLVLDPLVQEAVVTTLQVTIQRLNGSNYTEWFQTV